MLHITNKKPLFPISLTNISHPPRELFIEGDWQNLLGKPKVAVVGSRKASSPYGRAVTDQLVRALTAYGVVIVGGLALGIDSIAHISAIESGGLTIAVLPSGLDKIAPASHRNLAAEIVKKGGALITEYPPRTDCYKGNFIARNRIIAGLSDVVLITEAADRSGSLHTANFAVEQGKDVLSVPGPITSPTSTGCNNLIKSGATPVTGAADILNALKISMSDLAAQELVANSPAEYKILSLIKSGVNDNEELQHLSGLPLEEFLQVVSLLEISARIKAVGGGMWVLLS
jgi:DNA processing protein